MVFVVDMGDLFCEAVTSKWICKVIEAMKTNRNATFFLETKNPQRYFKFLDELPQNVILSTTIETNRRTDYVSKAPPPFCRYLAMKTLGWPRKHVSIEPIMDFDLATLVGWMKEINPELVSVGYDNYKHYLPEPSLHKTLQLIQELEKFTKVERKTIRNAWEK